MYLVSQRKDTNSENLDEEIWIKNNDAWNSTCVRLGNNELTTSEHDSTY